MQNCKPSNQEIIYFTHIPKCGGQSFRKGLEAAYKDKVCFYYFNPIRHRLSGQVNFLFGRFKTLIRKMIRDNKFQNYKIVYGHYCFDDIYVPSFITARRGAFFRDPVEWVGSFYFYIYEKYPGEIPRNPLTLIRKLDLSEGFCKYLGKYCVEDLDFVGLIENYQASLKLYEKIFQKKIPHFHENKTNNSPKTYREYFRNEGNLAEIEALMGKNMVIYEQALRKHKQLLAEHDIE